jgi:hypothetical protein
MLSEQGKQYLINQKIYTRNFGFPYLELPSNSSVKSIIENMESMQESVSSENYKSPELTSCEKLFQKTLCKYNQAYKQLNEERLRQVETLKKGENYLGKVISEQDGNYYYVNNFGFTHKYSADAWNNNNSNCPQSVIEGDNSYLREGPDMVSGQPCNIAGKIIQNEDTLEYAWVDIKGYKHIFSDSNWKKKSSTCKLDVLKLCNNNYNLIPEGSPMSCTTKCDSADINPHLWERLQKLNRKLISLAKKMSKEIQKLKIEDELLKEMLLKQQNDLDVYVIKLSEEQQNMKVQKRTMENISGEEENSQLIMKSNMSIFFILIAISIFVIIFTLKVMNSNSLSMKTIIIAVVLCIIILFFLRNRISFL